MKNKNNHTKLSSELDNLNNLDRCELLHRWKKLYGYEPPPRISQQLLLRAIAYKMQENALGGLKPATIKFLARVAEDKAKDLPTPPLTIKSGTRLLREWHGNTYEVEVMETGVLWGGKQYRSLSKVAHIITGTKRSGHLFFGLKARQSSEDTRKNAAMTSRGNLCEAQMGEAFPL